MPIAVIVSGKFLAHIPTFELTGQDEQQFGVKVPGVIHLVAASDEVVFGFALSRVVLPGRKSVGAGPFLGLSRN